MMRITALAAACFFVSAVAAAHDVPSLTPDNYDKITAGKTVFIKFFAPWVSIEPMNDRLNDCCLSVAMTHGRNTSAALVYLGG